jgi:hypothetical protein
LKKNNIDINNVLPIKDYNNNIETSFVETLVSKITNIKNDPASMIIEPNSKTRLQSTFNEDTIKVTYDYR